MRYDRLGFPIAPGFDPRPDEWDRLGGDAPAPPPRRARGRGKRLIVGVLLIGFVAAMAPAVLRLPMIRDAVVQWSLERAFVREARGQIGPAIGELGRAVRWSAAGGPRLCGSLCWRARLRMEAGDPEGAIADADRAVAAAPTTAEPRRLRALALVMLDDADGAVAAARSAFEMAPPGDPESLNHLAYVRALVGRELPAALADIESALAGDDFQPPELLDTRGFILHLLGRHQEAVDDLNRAIEGFQRQRREVASHAGHLDPDDVARRLRGLDQGLAVMHQHRGLACRAAGLARQAEQDFEIATRKGYAPERGVF